MSARRGLRLAGLCALLAGVHQACAAPAMTGTVLFGTGAGSMPLVLGSRVVGPPGSWTEVVFSDGSTFVLGPGAQLTVHRLLVDPATARLRVVASGGGGRLRVGAADGTAVDLSVAGAEVEVVGADAVVQPGPGGSVAMTGGRQVVVSQGSRRDTLRRPGFSVPLDGSGPRRDTEQQMAAGLAPFAPLAAAPAPARPSGRDRAVPARLALASLDAPPEVAAAGAVDLSTGLTSQAGNLTASLAPKSAALAAVPAVAVTTAATSSAVTTPTLVPTPTPNLIIPDIKYSAYSPSTPGGSSSPGPAAPAGPVAPTTPVTPPRPVLVPVDGALLAKVPSSAGPITVPGTGNTVSTALVPSNEHLSWGLYLPANGSASLALGGATLLQFGINGSVVPTGTLQGLTGSATYAGGMIGSVQTASGYAQRTGQFAQTWDFGTRTGALNANFNGGTWLGVALKAPAGSNVYLGAGNASNGQQSLHVGGTFYNSPPLGPGVFPAETAGKFTIGPSGPSLVGSAQGIFVGTRR